MRSKSGKQYRRIKSRLGIGTENDKTGLERELFGEITLHYKLRGHDRHLLQKGLSVPSIAYFYLS